MLSSRKRRQRAQAFNTPKVQLVYGFVPGFQGFLCKYRHPAARHQWLYLHHAACGAAQLYWDSNKAAPARLGGIQVRIQSCMARVDNPLHRGEVAVHEGLSLGLSWHHSEDGYPPPRLIFLFTSDLPRQKGSSALKQGSKSVCAEPQAVINCRTETDSLLTLFGEAAPNHTEQSVSWLFSNVC